MRPEPDNRSGHTARVLPSVLISRPANLSWPVSRKVGAWPAIVLAMNLVPGPAVLPW
jgi:hypothetical protein